MYRTDHVTRFVDALVSRGEMSPEAAAAIKHRARKEGGREQTFISARLYHVLGDHPTVEAFEKMWQNEFHILHPERHARERPGDALHRRVFIQCTIGYGSVVEAVLE